MTEATNYAATSNGDERQSLLFKSHAVFPAHLVAEAIRSGPYSTSANAIAELVDNSYDADATEIHIALICQRDSKSPHIIAVLDNGMGMDAENLRHCIQHGQHVQRRTPRSRIGKFGVGLLSSSFNQCKSLEVYSWTEGLREDNVNSTSLHVKNCPETLPEVVARPLPDFFEDTFRQFDREATELDTHGTLIVWRELDRLTWRKSGTLSEKLQHEIGRIYRNFLTSSEQKLRVVISQAEMISESNIQILSQAYVSPVDPLFISHWDCSELNQFARDFDQLKHDPSKYNISDEELASATRGSRKPTLFIPFDFENEIDNAYNEDGTIKQLVVPVPGSNGSTLGRYRILASYRRPKIVRAAAAVGSGALRNPGDTPYGKLAERLRGVSILRGGREISLDTNWLRADLTIDRWVALSIDFDPSLDPVFGVSNDKQRAGHLSSLAQVNTKLLDADSDEYNEHALRAAKKIQDILSRMRNLVDRVDTLSAVQTQLDLRHTDPAHESRQNLEGFTESMASRVERLPSASISGVDDIEPDVKRLVDAYVGTTIEDENAAKVRPEYVVVNGLRVDFATDSITGGSDLFTPVNNASGAIIIRLNAKHPLFAVLSQLLRSGAEDANAQSDAAEVKEKLDRAITVIRGLFLAFSRAELEAGDNMRDYFEEVRRKWSSIAKDLFKSDE